MVLGSQLGAVASILLSLASQAVVALPDAGGNLAATNELWERDPDGYLAQHDLSGGYLAERLANDELEDESLGRPKQGGFNRRPKAHGRPAGRKPRNGRKSHQAHGTRKGWRKALSKPHRPKPLTSRPGARRPADSPGPDSRSYATHTASRRDIVYTRRNPKANRPQRGRVGGTKANLRPIPRPPPSPGPGPPPNPPGPPNPPSPPYKARSEPHDE